MCFRSLRHILFISCNSPIGCDAILFAQVAPEGIPSDCIDGSTHLKIEEVEEIWMQEAIMKDETTEIHSEEQHIAESEVGLCATQHRVY